MSYEIPVLSGPEFGPMEDNITKQLVILCHGLGADGNDLIGLAPYFSQNLPNAKFVAPNAPFKCDMSPFGYQWFSLQERSEESMLAGVKIAMPILNSFIDSQLLKYELPEDKLALVGFSQGTMISVYTAPRRAKKIAGVVGYSGRLVGTKQLKEETRCHPPMVLINGDKDDLIPVESQPIAVEALTSSGIPVEGHIRPGLGHSIDEVGVDLANKFLTAIFS
ncbi:MAG: alpha/beta fold hydrolase [Pseudomonadota bacterium]|nr:alpha/beta fold hydrolase [Pseudomonadota bacterium]